MAKGAGVTITGGPTTVTVSWSEFRDGPGLKSLPAAIIAVPLGAVVTMALPGLGLIGAAIFAAVIVVTAAIAAVMVSGRNEARLGEWGLELCTYHGAARTSRRHVPLPIVVRVEPLWGSADPLSPNDPTEWGVAFIGPGGITEGLVTLNQAGVNELRERLSRTRLPGVFHDEISQKENLLSSACPKCGYDLVGLAEARCPECGVPISEATMELVRKIHAERRGGAGPQP
jgi:hypothetical protein